MDVHQDSIAVGSVAQDHGAEVTYLGISGTRPCDIAHLIRTRQSKAKHLALVYEAGPCGDWLSRDLTPKGDACGVLAPCVIPNKAGDRVTTDRRDAVQRARLMCAGELTPVDVPTVEDAAIRDLTRAREDPIGAFKATTFRLKAVLLGRVDTPRALMNFLALVPSAYSTAARPRQGSITNAGHTHARRVLVEGAWAYREPATVSRHLHLRRDAAPVWGHPRRREEADITPRAASEAGT
jgi:transposase